MGGEEEEQHLHCCKTENRTDPRRPDAQPRFEDRSTQTFSFALNPVRAPDMAPFQGSGTQRLSVRGALDSRTPFRARCETGVFASLTAAPEEPRALFHGNAGFRAHFPALFEPVPAGAQITEEREGEGKDERDAEISVEVQIGRKLREIGDEFQQEHLQLFSQHCREQMGLFQHLLTSLYDLLFLREEPRKTAAQR